MIISMIVAMGKNRVIGKDNDLPWHLPDDFKYFKETTKGHHVIMGRKNWDSLPPSFQPLPHRTNIIITRQKLDVIPNVHVVSSLEKSLEIASSNNEDEVFIIGGGEIYRMSLPYSDRIYLTEIVGEFDGNVTFPTFDTSEWKEISRRHHPKDDRHQFAFDFVVYSRVKNS